jgi:hypothetical protein
MLTDIQRKELEEMRAPNVRLHLAANQGSGPGAAVAFRCGDIARGDVYDWLATKDAEETTRQSATLRWAVIAGWAGIIGAVIGILALVLPLMPWWPK